MYRCEYCQEIFYKEEIFGVYINYGAICYLCYKKLKKEEIEHD